MKKFRFVIIPLIAFLFYYLYPTDISRKLESQLTKKCTELTFDKPLELIETRIKAKEAASMLASDVFVIYRAPELEFTRNVQKREIIDGLSGALLHVQSAKVGISRFKVLSTESSLIKVSLFVIAEWKEQTEAETLRAAEDVRLEFKKIDGEWLISRIETLERKTL